MATGSYVTVSRPVIPRRLRRNRGARRASRLRTTRKIEHRGETLNEPLLTRRSSPAQNGSPTPDDVGFVDHDIGGFEDVRTGGVSAMDSLGCSHRCEPFRRSKYSKSANEGADRRRHGHADHGPREASSGSSDM
jgi:hypothetical protein